jgi:hypothetical protein
MARAPRGRTRGRSQRASSRPKRRVERVDRFPGKGGPRSGSGRRSMFPGKYAPGQVPLAKLGLTVTPLAKDLLTRTADDLHDVDPVGPKTLSDAAEWCVRKATGTPLSD